MIYTCAEAAKVLRKLNEDLKVLRAKEVKGYRFTAAVDEDLESARPVYDYLQTQEEQRRIEARIRKVACDTLLKGIRVVDLLEKYDLSERTIRWRKHKALEYLAALYLAASFQYRITE